MTGWFSNKYRVAIYGQDATLVQRITDILKSWFKRKIVVETYTDPHQLFVDMNIAKANHIPFDLTIMTPSEEATGKILKQTNPEMDIVDCNDPKSLKKDTVRLTLKKHKELRLVSRG